MDIEKILESVQLSEDMTRAKNLSPAEVGDLLDIKLLNSVEHGDFSELLDEIRDEIERQVNELLFNQGLSAKDLRKLQASLKGNDAALAHLRNIHSAIKLYKALKDYGDIGDEEAVVDACNLVLHMARIKMQRDGVPLISRGLYSKHVAEAFEFWKQNRASEDGRLEATWQKELAARSAILSRVLGGHVVLMGEQQHVGTEGLDGKGDQITDYLFSHNITRNVTLVEIKTPQTALLGQPYRKTYALSQELSGAVAQVMLQRSDLAKAYFYKRGKSSQPFEVAAATCVVVAGSADLEIGNDEGKAAAFEMHRNAIAGQVKIVTFDELYNQFALFHNMEVPR